MLYFEADIQKTKGCKSYDNFYQHQEETDVLLNEVETAMKKMRKCKSADDIPAELITLSGEKGIKVMHTLCNLIWKTKNTKEKGHSRMPKNNRTIALSTHAEKDMQMTEPSCRNRRMKRNELFREGVNNTKRESDELRGKGSVAQGAMAQ